MIHENYSGEKIHALREAGTPSLLARILWTVLAFAAFFVFLLFVVGQAHAQEALNGGSSLGDGGSGTGGLTDDTSGDGASLPSSTRGDDVGGSAEPAGTVQEATEPAASTAEPPSGTVGETAGTVQPVAQTLEGDPQTTTEPATPQPADLAFDGTYSEPVAEQAEPVAPTVDPTQEAIAPVNDAVDPVSETPVLMGEPIGGTVEPAITPVTGAMEPMLAPVVVAPATDVGAVDPVVDEVASAVESVVEPAVYGAEPVTDTVQPLVEPVAQNAEAVDDPVVGAAYPLIDAAEPVAGPLGGAVKPVADIVIPVVDPVGAVVAPVTNATQPVIAPVVDATEPMVEPIVGTLEPVVEPVVETASPVIAPVVDGAEEPLVGTVEDFVSPVGDLGPGEVPITGPALGAAPTPAATTSIAEPAIVEPVVVEPVVVEPAVVESAVVPSLGGPAVEPVEAPAVVELAPASALGLATSPEPTKPVFAPALDEPAAVLVPEDVGVASSSPSAMEGLVSPAPITASAPEARAAVRAYVAADLLEPYPGNVSHRLTGGNWAALGETFGEAPLVADGVGVARDVLPWSLPVPAPPVAGGSSGASGSSSGGIGFGVAVLSLLALLYLGGKPLLSARDLLGPASVPQLIPELPG